MNITKQDIIDYKTKMARKSKPASLSPRQRKEKTRAKTRQYISNGDIIREPCLICGDTPTETHHLNYDDPKAVVFLCKYHHTILHYYKQLRENGKISSITQNCAEKYHKTYTKLHKY